MKKYVVYKLQIKESKNEHVLTPEYHTDTETDPGYKFVEDFFGCHEIDVDWYKISREER